jgi:hypothetical protein
LRKRLRSFLSKRAIMTVTLLLSRGLENGTSRKPLGRPSVGEGSVRDADGRQVRLEKLRGLT